MILSHITSLCHYYKKRGFQNPPQENKGTVLQLSSEGATFTRLLRRSGFAKGEVNSLISGALQALSPNQPFLGQFSGGCFAKLPFRTLKLYHHLRWERIQHGFLASFQLRDDNEHYGFMLYHSPLSIAFTLLLSKSNTF